MKKCIAILLCICSLCALAITASASDSEPDYMAEYEAQYGKMPVAADYSSDEEYQTAYDIWLAGFIPYVDMRSAEWSRQNAAAEEAAVQNFIEAESPVTLPETFESAGVNNAVDTSVSISPGSDDKYPVGSYVDSAGNVYSQDGTLLSPGTTPAVEPADLVPLAADVRSGSVTVEAAPAENGAPVYHVADLRPGTDSAVSAPVGLKALIISIFGEYTPVTTTSVVSETVGSEVNQYLVETVASGSAGVDYEWIAGVALFGILLFCLMKLLGGVVK